jgi:hypothetical protein
MHSKNRALTIFAKGKSYNNTGFTGLTGYPTRISKTGIAAKEQGAQKKKFCGPYVSLLVLCVL